MQRKVNRSDSDYHYGKEKYKRNVYKMMLKCKQREVMSGDINDYSRYKDGIVYNEPCVLAGCRVSYTREFDRQMDERVVKLWREGQFKEFCNMLPEYADYCYGEGNMHDTVMLLGMLGWDKYDGKDTHNGDIVLIVLTTLFQQVVINLTRTHYYALHALRIKLVDFTDGWQEGAVRQFFEIDYNSTVGLINIAHQALRIFSFAQ